MSISRKHGFDVTPDQFYHFVLALVPIVYNNLRNSNLKEIDVANLNLGNIEK